MGFHTFDPDRADRLTDVSRYRWCSSEELLSLVAPASDEELADLGSGTGFYTDPVAERARLVHAVDVQPEMHDLYADRGMPDNVRPVTAEIADLPFEDGSLDCVFSTMTYHEFSGSEAVAEIRRVLRPGGRVVTVDWDRNGAGGGGPPRAERHGLGHAVSAFADAGLTIEHAVSRTETFLCSARRDA
ncbi:class I SAM-dependent methyltransferase [Natronomonas sp.]|uniref:class I SAM-dependent methyltransferase n=1 Tax=Natronomonas sp. TaxID=2184060 RepID=UPI002634D943|nr:class I SAM-dependent methyltransferase [Natronomonas sp.]